MKILIIALLVMLGGCTVTQHYILTWHTNSDDDLAGYRVYWKDSAQQFNAGHMTDVGKQTSFNLTAEHINTMLAVTAYDYSGNESEFSESIVYSQEAGGKIALEKL